MAGSDCHDLLKPQGGSQPPAKPARRKPLTMYGQLRINCQSKPDRWFSIIKMIGPWLSPKCHGETHHPYGFPGSPGCEGLKEALNP